MTKKRQVTAPPTIYNTSTGGIIERPAHCNKAMMDEIDILIEDALTHNKQEDIGTYTDKKWKEMVECNFHAISAHPNPSEAMLLDCLKRSNRAKQNLDVFIEPTARTCVAFEWWQNYPDDLTPQDMKRVLDTDAAKKRFAFAKAMNLTPEGHNTLAIELVTMGKNELELP